MTGDTAAARDGAAPDGSAPDGGAVDGRAPGREVVAVLGAGAMGLLHLLVLRAAAGGPAGLPPLVVVCDPLAERRELALRLGAAAAAEPGAAMRRAVLEASGGRGADLVFDTVGGAAVLSDALALGRPGSATVLFAHAASQGEAAGFDLNAFFKSERQLLATYSSGAAEQREIFDLLASGRLDPRPLVSHRLPLARAAEAVELATSHRALKVLLVADAEGVDGAGSVSGAGGVDDEGRDAR